MRAALLRFLVPCVSLSLGACSGKDDPGSEGTGDEIAQELCDSADEENPFVAGMSKTSPGGLTIVALSAEPAPPSQGRNRWVFEVRDAGGTPMEGANVQVACTMFHPKGGTHGCPTTPGVIDQGAGKYEAYPIIFNMAGHWALDVGVVSEGGVEDVVFSLCVP